MRLDTFINRPVLSTVISILIVILGCLGLMSLPISQYPDIAPPTVSVSTSYMGANAQTVLNSVVAPLEEAINGVENMDFMSSTATNTGSGSISITFKQGTDPNMAAVNVQNCVAKATGYLPAEVTRVGVMTMKRQSSMLVVFSLVDTEDRYTSEFIENYAKINIIPQIQRCEGVGEASVMGGNYSMRIWLDPEKMATYGLMPADISGILAEQNIEAAPGNIGEREGNTFQYTLRYKGRLQQAEEFENMVIKSNPDGTMVRVKDVARVELGRESYAWGGKVNGHKACTAIVFQLAGSNATAAIQSIEAALDECSKSLAPGLEINVVQNANDFLFASINEVVKTLVEAFILVFLVVFLFLQDMRSTLIPTIAIPVGPDSLVVTWHPGSADQDCGFYLENASGNICLQHNPNSLFPDGGRHLIANPCSTDGATGIHTFSLAAVSADTLCGTISGGASDQPFGSEQVITAFANPGYRFTGWDDGSRLNPRTLYLSSDTLLTALFEPLGTDTLAYATTDVSGKFAHSGAISFAVKFPKECLPGHREVVGLQFMTAVSGSYTISFYEDADGQPGSLTFTHTLSCPAGLVPYSMRNAPLPIKQSKDLWVVISTEAEDVLVPYDYWPGTDNGSLVSFNNGATWISLSDEGFYGSWIIRAITTYDSTLYNLTLRSDDESMGTTEGSGSYLYGTRVPARAIPMPGYHFVRWSDQSTANPHNISMRSDLSVTAYFAEGEVSASAPDGLQPRAILQGLRLTLEQAEGLPVRLYDLQGRCLYATPAYHGQPIQLPCAGVYLLHTAASPAPQRLIAY